MCVGCGLPTTHLGTIQSITFFPIIIFVVYTFLWAWWMVTRLRVENYFLDKTIKIIDFVKTIYK